jgi:hypothetical protein
MLIQQTEAIQLFETLGFPTATKWSCERLQKKITGLPFIVDEQTDAEGSQDILNAILAAIAEEREIKVGMKLYLDDEGIACDAEVKKSKVKKKKSKEPKKKKVGIIASIQEFLNEASEEQPISKIDICSKLKERFPDREQSSMQRTVNVQVPTRLRVDKDIHVTKNKQGYWID